MPTATPRQAKKVSVLDTPQVALWYYPEDRIIHHEIKQFLSGKSLRDFLRTVAGLFEQHRAEKWLSDDRRVPVIRPGDIDWGDADWFPRAASAGWKYWAIVRPEKLVGQAVMRELSEKYARHGVTSEWFNDPADALWWLQSR